MPHGIGNFSNTQKGLGAWKIEALKDDIEATAEELRFTTADDHTRLKPDVVQDLVVVCRYTLEEPV